MKLFITGCDHGLGFGLARKALSEGHTVFASRYLPASSKLEALQADFSSALFLVPLDIGSDESVTAAKEAVLKETDCLDAIISCAGILGEREVEGAPQSDHNLLLQVININALGAVRLTEAFYPLLQKSAVKKLFFVSSEAGSIRECHRRDWFGYCMSKAALNMYGKLLDNRLRPEGFDIRLYHPGWMRTYMNGYLDTAATLDIDTAADYAWDYFREPANKDSVVLRGYNKKEWDF